MKLFSALNMSLKSIIWVLYKTYCSAAMKTFLGVFIALDLTIFKNEKSIVNVDITLNPLLSLYSLIADYYKWLFHTTFSLQPNDKPGFWLSLSTWSVEVIVWLYWKRMICFQQHSPSKYLLDWTCQNLVLPLFSP